MRDHRIAAGVALVAAALAAVEVQIHEHVFPTAAASVMFLGLAVGGCALIVQGWRGRYSGPTHTERFRPLEPGERNGRLARLARVPNMEFAALWEQLLQEEGIEVFAQRGPNRLFSQPVTLWVGEHNLARARELFPELQEQR